MSGFKPFDNDDFDRVFMTTTELVDNFVGEQLWLVGSNEYGQLCNNTNSSNSSLAQPTGGGANWKKVSAGPSLQSIAAIKTDGTLWVCGRNDKGQLGDNTTSSRSSLITTIGGGTNWKQVACGWLHTAAIKTDGTLWACGYNIFGQLGDNTVVDKSSLVTLAGEGTWKQVACGRYNTIGIKTDGTIWGCGYGGNGELGDGFTGTSRISFVTLAGGGTWKQVACGQNSTAAIKSDGTLWTWGMNTYGQLGTNNTSNYSSPVTTAGGGTNWKQVGLGINVIAAIKTDGTLWACGYNIFGQLGDNTTSNRSSPVTIAGGGTNWKQVAGGHSHTAAVKTDGTLWVWGRNNYGQLGTNNTSNYSSPVTTITGTPNWQQVSCCVTNTFAIGY